MTTQKHQFLGSPSSTLHHLGKMAQSNVALLTPSRSIFLDNWDHTQFDMAENNSKLQDKIQENYDKKIKALSAEVKSLETQGKTQDEIKATLKEKKNKILQDAFDQALKDLKINKKENGKSTPVTYLEVVNDPDAGPKIEAIFKKYSDKVEADVDTAVDKYLDQKTIAAGKLTSALKAIPGATAATDFDSPNPEIQRLQEILDARNNVLDTGRKGRNEMFDKEAMIYKATTTSIDKLTSPDGGKIDDYDDGVNPFNKINDTNSPTRMKLNGYLYANYIFNGGGQTGMLSVNESIKKPYELYHSTLGDSRLTDKDVMEGLSLNRYAKDAKEYTTFDRPMALIATMMQLIDNNLKDPTEHQRYLEYAKTKFAELKTGEAASDEEKQLQILFSIKSRAEFLQVDPNWKKTVDSIDQLTDPDGSNAKINDYPGTGSDNKKSPTRLQLNGYLYSTYLFGGKDTSVIGINFNRAVQMFEDSGTLDDSFDQKHLERDREGKNDGFGLGTYLKQYESRPDTVKGVMAGLLKQADTLPEAQKEIYKQYLTKIFDGISNEETEDKQLMVLSTIRSPLEAAAFTNDRQRNNTFDLLLAAASQHNQFKFSKEITDVFAADKPTLKVEQYNEIAAKARQEIQAFIISRADQDMKSLREKYKVLADSKKPVVEKADLEPLRLAIEENNKQFELARLVVKSDTLDSVIKDKYLEKSLTAEKTYLERSKELDAKIQEVKDKASGKIPTATVDSVSPTGSTGSTESGSEDKETSDEPDRYTLAWKDAVRVTPLYADYTGPLIADSTDPDEKVIGYDSKGNRIATLDNNTEVIRTEKDSAVLARKIEGLNFIVVTYKGKKMWIPEEQLFESEDKPETTTPSTTESKESDDYTTAWAAGVETESVFKLQEGSFQAKSANGAKLNVRNEKGEIIDQIDAVSTLLRSDEDAAKKARRVNNVNFIQMTYKNNKVWIAENLLTYQPPPKIG